MKSLRLYKASAGSGKTFALAVEYIALLAMNPMEYQHILAVTFTNKATAEMKERILSTLYGIAHGLESADDYVEKVLENLEGKAEMPQWKVEPYASLLRSMDVKMLRQQAGEALTNIVHDYSRFHVETIDAFFQRMVREIANELELSTHLRVELDEKEVLSDAIDRIIENLKEGSSEFRSIIAFIEEKIRTNRSWQVEGTVKEFGQNIFKEKYLVNEEEVRKKITDVGELHRYRALIQQQLEAKQEAVTQQAQQLLMAYEQSGITPKEGTAAVVTFLGKVVSGDFAKPTSKIFSPAIEAYTQASDKWLKKTCRNSDAFLPCIEGRLMPMLTELFVRHAEYQSHRHTVAAIAQHLYSLMLLNRISQTVKSLNEESGRVLLAETAHFLRGVINHHDLPFIYEKTGAVIRHIMIDEFQDTSALQWENFKPLVMHCLSTGGTSLIVGDVKQSIYRFRNSDWRILNNIEGDKDLTPYIETIPAEFNFRSSRRVVEFNNQLFEKATALLKEDCPALETAYDQLEQKPKNTEEMGFVRVENIHFHSLAEESGEDTEEQGTRSEVQEVGMERLQLTVKELMDAGVKANDITILTRTNREVPQISDYFDRHQEVVNVKVVSDDAFRLDASPAIQLLVGALRALAAPAEKLHLATLVYLYQSLLHHLNILDVEELDAYLPSAFQTNQRTALQAEPLVELTEHLYQIFELHQLKDQDAYLFCFHDLLAQYAEEHPCDLDSFLQAWDEQLCQKTIPNGALEGVRIMTMHKSKGLEFHSVIIPSCSWRIKPNDSEIIWCVPTVKPYSQMPLLPVSVSRATPDSIFCDDRAAEDLKTLVDNINLLYVAFTRAKHNLIIQTGNKPGESPDPKGKIDSVQTLLIQAMPDNMEQTEVDEDITCYQKGEIVESPPAPEGGVAGRSNPLKWDAVSQPVNFCSHPSVATFRQSYASDLFLTAESPRPAARQHARRVQLIAQGNLYHAILQHIRTPEDLPHAIRMLQSKGCIPTPQQAQAAQTAVADLLQRITSLYPEWFAPHWQVLTERPILFLQERTLHTRRPDRVIVNGTSAILIDYKTAQGVLRTAPDGTLVAPTKHVDQLKHYKRLLTQIGYTDVKAYLWYMLEDRVVEV